jgi:hypothetical protein
VAVGAIAAVIGAVAVLLPQLREDDPPPPTTTVSRTTVTTPKLTLHIADPAPAQPVDWCIKVRITADKPLPKEKSLWVVVATSDPDTDSTVRTLHLQRRPVPVLGDTVAWTAIAYIGAQGAVGKHDWDDQFTIMAVTTTGGVTKDWGYMADRALNVDDDAVIPSAVLPTGAVEEHSVTVTRKHNDRCPFES